MKKQYTAADLPNKQYHNAVGISSSMLKSAATETLEKVHWKYFRPEREELVPTPAMQLGTAVHCAVLESAEFDKIYVDTSKVDGRTVAGNKLKMEIEQGGKIGLKNYQQVIDMRNAILAHKDAAKLLRNSINEESFFWGEDKKCRVDFYDPDLGIMGDIKTAADASFDGFSKAILNFRYDIQAAHYLEGIQQFYPDIERFMFVVVESSAPHSVAVYELDEVALDIGRGDAAIAYERIKEAAETDRWPGYVTAKISLPQWYSLRRIEGGE